MRPPLSASGAAPAARAPMPRAGWRSVLRGACLAGVAALLMAGCVTPPPAPGSAEAEVLRQWGTPTGRYALPASGQRLEYATGPFGRTTWMIDLDSAGRVLRSEQVLTEARFADFQARVGQTPGMPRDEVLRTLGRPGQVRGGGWQGGEVWSWRYPTNDCLWFQSSIGDDGRARDGAYAPDPLCERPSDRIR